MLASFTRRRPEPYVVPGNPIKMSGFAPPPDRRGPWLGEHTDDILRDLLGLDDERITTLRAEGIVG